MRALIVVDIQNDFADPKGSLYVKNGDQVIKPINALTARAIERDHLVVFTRDWHGLTSKHFKCFGGTWPVHCVEETEGAEFHTGLSIPRGSFIVSKGIGVNEDGYSGFDKWVQLEVTVTKFERVNLACHNNNTLSKLLDYHRIFVVYIAGLATDYCVKATALETVKLLYKVKVVIDACRAVNINPRDGDKAVEEMRAVGVEIVTSADVLAGRA